MSRINIKNKKPLRGEITILPDKSISHRAVILLSLSEGESVIRNFLHAEDSVRTLNAFRQMGIDIHTEHRAQNTEHPEKLRNGAGRAPSKQLAGKQSTDLIITGKGLSGLKKPEKEIDCGNSGTTARLLCGVLAGQPFPATLTGDESLKSRPMQRVIDPLTKMGAVIEANEGEYLPLTIKGGELSPISYDSPIASAQVKSAILLAGLYCKGITSVTGPARSRDHTEKMLEVAGVKVSTEGLKVSVTGPARIKPMDIIIPGDFSSAAFFIVAGIIVPDSEILIKNVGINPTRSGLLNILEKMGADINTDNERVVSGEQVADIKVKHSGLKGVTSGKDFGNELLVSAIDEFPILCVAASKARGTTKITGVRELRVKESDRIASMSKELQKMGVELEELDDGIIIKGQDSLKASSFQSYGDHRIAMAMAVAGLTADGESVIENTDCVNTSFPSFEDTLRELMNH